MKKKLLSMVLAMIMLSGALVGCGDNSAATTGGSSGMPAGNGDYAYIDEYVKNLAAEHTFGGATFKIVGLENSFPVSEELTGSLESDALWNRQKALEDIFDIDIVTQTVDMGSYDGPSLPTALYVIDQVTAGLQEIDLVNANLSYGGKAMLEKNILMEVHGLDAVDFSRSWWLNDIEDQLSVGGNLYFLTGKIITQHYGDASCLLFNKKVVEDYNIEEPYEIVKSGEWTFDKMNEIAQQLPAEGDVYRYMMREAGKSFFFGGGYSITTKNDKDIPEISSSLSNEAAEYINKLGSVFGDTSITVNYSKYADFGAAVPNDMDKQEDIFSDGKVLFWAVHMSTVSGMREFDAKFGILPIPKRDASQKEYISYTDAGAVNGYYVPSNVKNPTMVGYVVEGMAALSEKYIEPAYYESALVQRGVYDWDSKEMLDIIYKTKKLDIADIYGFGDVVSLVENNCNGSKADLASGYASTAKVSNNNVKSLLKAIGLK